MMSGNANVKILSNPNTTDTTHTVPNASSVEMVVLMERRRL